MRSWTKAKGAAIPKAMELILFANTKLNVQPDIGLTTAVAAHRVSLGFAFALWDHLRGCGPLTFLVQGAGNHHFGFIAAVLALAHVFEFLFSHVVYLR
jgi:hypothetical protein